MPGIQRQPALALANPPLGRAGRIVLGGVAVAGLALVGAWSVERLDDLVLAVPLVLVSFVVCRRLPASAIAGVLVLTACFGSLQAYLGVDPTRAIDLVLAGLWASVLWRLALERRDAPPLIPFGVLAIIVYAALTAAELLAADDVGLALRSFRAGGWYMLALPVVALTLSDARAQRRATRALIVLAGAVGGYGVIQLVLGPTHQELGLPRYAQMLLSNPDVDPGTLPPVGSFATPHQLGGWTGLAAPFMAACALSLRGRWRVGAAVSSGLCVIATLGSEARAGAIGAAIGFALVLVLLSASPAFPGLRLGPVTLAVTVTAVLAGATLAVAVGREPGRLERFAGLTPHNIKTDEAYNARIERWRTTIRDIRREPFGFGLGSAGGLQRSTGRFVTTGSSEIDNSYLKVGYEQGVGAMLVFTGAIALLLGGMARRSLGLRSPERAAIAIASTGALASFGVILLTGEYAEGAIGLAGWMIGGIGLAELLTLDPSA